MSSHTISGIFLLVLHFLTEILIFCHCLSSKLIACYVTLLNHFLIFNFILNIFQYCQVCVIWNLQSAFFLNKQKRILLSLFHLRMLESNERMISTKVSFRLKSTWFRILCAMKFLRTHFVKQNSFIALKWKMGSLFGLNFHGFRNNSEWFKIGRRLP